MYKSHELRRKLYKLRELCSYGLSRERVKDLRTVGDTSQECVRLNQAHLGFVEREWFPARLDFSCEGRVYPTWCWNTVFSKTEAISVFIFGYNSSLKILPAKVLNEVLSRTVQNG